VAPYGHPAINSTPEGVIHAKDLPMKVAAIVLAAGNSSRMGRAKQMLPFGTSTILETVIATVHESKANSINVVLGANRAEIEPILAGLDVEVFVNPQPELGMLSSVQCCISRLDGDVDAFLFVLGDQPQIRREIVDHLIDRASLSAKGIFVPTYSGKRGHPLLIRASHRAEILQLPNSGGLNKLLHDHPDDVEEVPVDTDTILKDIDTPEDYDLAIRDATSNSEI
jgi:molybdenum cofactor cytidylyltransferase